MAKMPEDELKALLAAEKAGALSSMNQAKLSEERERAMDYYNGDMSSDMPTVTDRSKAVSYDVSDTVEGLMPALMEIFCSGDEVVKFSPVSEKDEPQAEQETAYVNHVFMQENPGFLITYSFIKDSLLEKNGIVKVFWHVSEDEERKTYLDQPDDVYALFLADDDVKIVEHTEHEPEGPPPGQPTPADMAGNAMPPQQIPPQQIPPQQIPLQGQGGVAQMPQGAPAPALGAPTAPTAPGAPGAPPPVDPDALNELIDTAAAFGPTHDFTVVRKRKRAGCRVEAVPPEEFGCGRTAKLGQPLDYSFHQVRRTQSALIDDGFDVGQVEELPTAPFDTSSEAIARDTVDERQQASRDDMNESNRLIVVTEHYCRLDYDGSGAKLWRVTTGGDSELVVLKRNGKLDIEQVEFDPFASITPVIVTHRFFGKSLADLVIDIQRIKTSMLRGIADNVYLANNQRLEVAEAYSHPKTLDDILDNRIGGIVRTKQPGGVNPIANQAIGDFVFPVIEYFDQVREWRTGVTRHGQGINSDALQNIGDDARQQMQDAAMEKTRLIARIFAETGFKDLFWKIHATIRRHENSKPTVKLLGKWVTVDPQEWERRDHLTATVGLGGGSKAAQIAFWGNEVSTQQESLQLVPGLTTPGKIFNALKKRMELAGYKDVDQYWQNPEDHPQQQQKPDPKTLEVQGKLQIAQQSAQADQQRDQMMAQTDHAAAVAKAQTDQATAAAKIQGDRQKMAMQMELQRQKLNAEHELKMQQMQGEFALRSAQLEQEAQLEREAMIVGAKTKIATSAVKMGGEPG